MKHFLKVGIAVIAILVFAGSTTMFARPGRTNRNGGYNRSGAYHYHNRGSNSSTGNGKVIASAATAPAEKIFILADQSEKLYHRESCETIKGKKVTEMDKSKAINEGYTACPVCNPGE